MDKIKSLVKKAFNRFGYEIKKIDKSAATGFDFWVWLKKTQNIRTVIDIGANDGAFGQFIARYFNATSVYAFEPLPSCIPEIEKRFSNISNLKIFNVALSNYTGSETLYLNSYAPASSLLRVSDISKKEFPQTVGERPITVKVAQVDDIIDANSLIKNIFIKIDIQGMEDRVINGGKNVFSAAKCILVEMSFVPMYEGQPLFEEVHTLLVDLGYRFAGIKNQINSEKTGRPLFCHYLYLKN